MASRKAAFDDADGKCEGCIEHQGGGIMKECRIVGSDGFEDDDDFCGNCLGRGTQCTWYRMVKLMEADTEEEEEDTQ